MEFIDMEGRRYRIKEVSGIHPNPWLFNGKEYHYQDWRIEDDSGSRRILRCGVGVTSCRLNEWGGSSPRNLSDKFRVIFPRLEKCWLVDGRQHFQHAFLFFYGGLLEAWKNDESDQWQQRAVDSDFADKTFLQVEMLLDSKVNKRQEDVRVITGFAVS